MYRLVSELWASVLSKICIVATLALVLERSGLVNERSILAAKIEVSIWIFLAPKMSAVYIGLTEKVLTVAFVKCKPGLFKSFGVLIFSHFLSQLRPWIQVPGVS